MKISKAHQKFADYLNNPRVLEHPEEFLGTNWKDVLNFWLFLDTLSDDQLKIVNNRYWELNAARTAAQDAAYDAARAVSDVAPAAYDASYVVAEEASQYDLHYAAWYAACYATYELIGSHILLTQNKSLTFLPMFLNL